MIPYSERKRSNLCIHISFLLLVFLVILFISFLASVPPVSRDALTHHLAVPKMYLDHGGIYEIPHLKFSYYPMNLDLLYMVPLYFNNDILPKFIHFGFALSTAMMLFVYMSRRLHIVYAYAGSLFFLTIPVIVRLSSTVYVDLGLISFLFAALLFLFRWIEKDFRAKYLLICAIFCGLAMGTKYNGLVGFFLLVMFVAFVYSRYHGHQALYEAKCIGWTILFIVVALLIFSPWMIRNFAWTGNPVYPLYKSIFNSENISENNDSKVFIEERPHMSHIQIRRQIYKESWMEIVAIPLRVFFQGRDDSPKYFDGKTSPFLLILPLFAFLGFSRAGKQEKLEKLLLLFYSSLFLFYACAQTSIRIRYFSPILPPLVVLSMFGLYNIKTVIYNKYHNTSEFFSNICVASIFIIMMSLNAIYMGNRFEKDQPLQYISGEMSRDEYIQTYRPEYASFQYANNNIEKKAKILGVYLGNRGYYSDLPIRFSRNTLLEFASQVKSGKEVAEKLYNIKFTHLLVNFQLFNQMVSQCSNDEKKVLKEFFNNWTTQEFAKDGYGLLTLKSLND